MKPDLRFLLPNRISGQIALIIVASLVAVHFIIAGAFLLRAYQQKEARPPIHPGEIEVIVAQLDAAPAQDRARLAETLGSLFPDLTLKLEPTPVIDWSKPEVGPGLRWFGRRLGASMQVATDPRDGNGPPRRHVLVKMHDGQVLSVQWPPPPTRWWLFDPMMVTLLSIAIIVTGLGIWAARAVTAPLRSFAAAAESFSPDGAIALLPERGPREIRTAAKALNQMRARIKNLVDDRTRTLVAVGHDLRTPITRLRLSSEFVSDETLRSQMWRDLDQMKAMVDSILVHLREGRSARNLVSVDVAACVQTVCDAFADGGADVRLMQTESASVRAQPDELLRAVSNVVDNAVRYAGGATVSVLRAEGRVTICVEDEGPGIADERKDAMLEPFVRGEPARSMDEESGFGLGLSIARAIVGGIGGKLILADRQPRGLSVRIELPAEAAEPVAAPVGPVPVAALAVEGRARAETGVLTVVKN